MDWTPFTIKRSQDRKLTENKVVFHRVDDDNILVEPGDAEKVRALFNDDVAAKLNKAKKVEKEGPITVTPEQRVIIPEKEGLRETFEFLRALNGLFFEVKAPHIENLENCEIDLSQEKDDKLRYNIYVMAYPKVKDGKFAIAPIQSVKVFKTQIFMIGGCKDSWVCNEETKEQMLKDGFSLFEDEDKILIAAWKGRTLFFLPDISHEKPELGMDVVNDKINLIKVIVLTFAKSNMPCDTSQVEKHINDIRSRIYFDGQVPEKVLGSLKQRYIEDEGQIKSELNNCNKRIKDLSSQLTGEYSSMVRLEHSLKMVGLVSVDVEAKFKAEMEKLKVHPMVANVKFDKAGEKLTVITNPVPTHGVWVGKYILTLPMTLKAENQVEIRNLFPQPKTKRHHPHIESNGNTCWGNIKNVIIEMSARMSLFELVDLLISFLESVNITDPWGQHISEWKDKETKKYYEGMFGKPPKSLKKEEEGEDAEVPEG